ncbi:MAG TPA: ferritin-like domain-containing protein [Hymenobacter sp.]|uniref:ferritin-like domain-containing protein n=1 Tax=Hymenobacter sp. TaxID=1898978 RepID=UPI002D7E1960|nr:ferritin-like domain-containing protein [Hymenobacter sp.]HET9502476.1 ferritin-like domain-containing protein [Hymenobacter sp.]
MSHNPSTGLQPHEAGIDRPLHVPIKRRSFFMYAGATAGATALVLAGCDKDDNNNPSLLDVGSGDGGILNYAYALEQLEAAFYAQIKLGSYYTGSAITAAEKQIFDDLALHEAIHRDFLKAALAAASITPLPDLKPEFGSINFGDRNSILEAAQTFEDTGVAAYNGAGRFLTSNANLALAGKIVSVEARHAALIRDLRSYNTFVDNTVVNLFTQTAGAAPGTGSAASPQGNGNPGPGQERSKRPPTVLASVNNFLADGSKLSANSFA